LASFTPCEWPETFANKETYLAHLKSIGQLPDGFTVGTAPLTFYPAELGEPGPSAKPAKMDIAMIALDEPTSEYAAVFTKNSFPGAPVVVGREMMRNGQKLGGVVVNNKVCMCMLCYAI
jgi:glutamate N-acetyltransferase/amino-acid N-acetyltransferase